MINIFLDDLRPNPIGFILAKSDLVCRKWLLLNKSFVNILSLDHDLGEDETGYDFVKWLVETGMSDPSIYPKEIYLHTANPVGRHNMFQLLERYKPDEVKLHNGPMPNND